MSLGTDWLDNPNTVLPSMVLMAVWQGVGLEMLEAALMDGASWLSIYWRIAVPLSAPVFATASILSFIALWGNLLWPAMSLRSPALFPVPLAACYQGICGDITRLPITGSVMALGVVMALPALLLFLLFQRWFVRSITAGAVTD